MAIHKQQIQRASKTSPQVAQSNRVPAPIGGIDARTILSTGDPMFCIYAFNILPSEYGMKVRNGYREWQVGLDNGNPLGVGTIIPFGGLDEDATDDRLFAVTNEGIWNCTTEHAAPVLMLDFALPGNGGNTTAAAGKGVYAHYITDAAEELLFYADSANGLFQYSEVTDAWIRATAITGPVIEDIRFVMTHKKQLWLIEEDSADAWFLPEATIGGAASQFFFGPKFLHSGDCAGLYSWTIDGGEGVDDYFVVVSRPGDVLVYKGTDPADADAWFLTGQYYIGAVPAGRRFGTETGGDLHLLSVYGLTAMNEIIRGVDGKNIRADTESKKIAAIIRQQMQDYRSELGWDVKVLPSLGSIVIAQPKRLDDVYYQYVMNTTTGGWAMWRELPVDAFDEWNGSVYFGDQQNRLCIMDVNSDNIPIAPTPMDNGTAINFSLLTTFQDYGQPALFKRVKYIRPDFVSLQKPAVTVRARYDYDLDEVLNISVDPLTGESLWDIGMWDQSFWGGSAPKGWHEVKGGWGMGRTVAIAMSGKTRGETTLISWDVVWDTGAPL